MLQPGDSIPDFSLQAGTGATVASLRLQGQRWVLYFYPKDHTPGCTIETKEFGAAQAEFRSRGVEVFGCSDGDVAAKTAFATDCGAPDLPLLSDPDHAVASAFGTWVDGGTREVGRSTFLIDAKGRVERVWPRVKPSGHAAEVLAALD
ncbi:MAG: peroxiredoxin [Candidatus Dormibacteria bacterium]